MLYRARRGLWAAKFGIVMKCIHTNHPRENRVMSKRELTRLLGDVATKRACRVRDKKKYIQNEFDQGVRYSQDCMDLLAIVCFENILNIDPGHVLAWAYKGASLTRLGRDEEAIDAYARGLALEPTNCYCHYNRGYCLMKLERYEEARYHFNEASKTNSRDKDTWVFMGICNEKLDCRDRALVCFDRALSIDSDFLPALDNKGRTLQKLKLYEQALACFDRSIASDPCANLFERGICFAELGRDVEALACFDQFLESNSDHEQCHSARNVVLERKLEADKKKADFIATDWNKKGLDYLSTGQLDKALECFDNLLSLNPNDKTGHVNKGTALYRLGRFIEASESNDRALELDADYAIAWNNKGITFQRTENFDKAVECFEKATAIDPNYKNAWVNLGHIFSTRDFDEKALVCYDKALVIDPYDAKLFWTKKRVLHDISYFVPQVEKQ